MIGTEDRQFKLVIDNKPYKSGDEWTILNDPGVKETISNGDEEIIKSLVAYLRVSGIGE